MSQDLAQLVERKARLQEQMNEIDTKIYEHKKVRQAELLAELKELGLEDKSERRASATGITRQRDPNKPCPVCGETGHDARRHKGEPKKKKT
jgi:DNA repair exonuclease SbcCD ATPase subunit